VLPLELLAHELDQLVVEVLSTEMGVSSGGLDFEQLVLDGQDGHIKGTSTEIEDENVALALCGLVQTVGNGGSSGLVNDTQDFETGNGTGILGGLALRVVEVGRDSDDSLGHSLAQEAFGNLLHLSE